MLSLKQFIDQKSKPDDLITESEQVKQQLDELFGTAQQWIKDWKLSKEEQKKLEGEHDELILLVNKIINSNKPVATKKKELQDVRKRINDVVGKMKNKPGRYWHD